MTTPGGRGSGAASEDLQAVLAARRELGPEYDVALVDSFVERAEAHLAARFPPLVAPPGAGTVDVGAGGLALAAATVAWGLLSTFLAVVAGSRGDPVLGLAVLAGWASLGLCDLVYVVLAMGRRGRRPH